jgi:hypothetical protein
VCSNWNYHNCSANDYSSDNGSSNHSTAYDGSANYVSTVQRANDFATGFVRATYRAYDDSLPVWCHRAKGRNWSGSVVCVRGLHVWVDVLRLG